MRNLYQVIKRPIITEKSTHKASENKYTFEVDKQASKEDVKQAIEKAFDVGVLDVKTATIHGKKIRVGRRRIPTKKSDWKKAVVTVREGDKIEAFEVGG